MKKLVVLFLLFLFPLNSFAIGIIVPPDLGSICHIYDSGISADGRFQIVEQGYENGLLFIRFIHNPQEDLSGFYFAGNLVDGETCQYLGIGARFEYFDNFELPSGDYTLRFTTDSSFQIYDSNTGSPFDCEGCSRIFTPTDEPPYNSTLIYFTLRPCRILT